MPQSVDDIDNVLPEAVGNMYLARLVLQPDNLGGRQPRGDIRFTDVVQITQDVLFLFFARPTAPYPEGEPVQLDFGQRRRSQAAVG